MSNLETALISLFDRNRIVFWYDEKKELRQEFDEVWLTGVEKLEIAGNEFWLKFHVLREKPASKFLLYHCGTKPEDEKNWLLDVLLAHAEFRADQVSLWLSELGLRPDDWDFVQAHQAFFKSETNRQNFHNLYVSVTSESIEKEKLILSCCMDSPVIITLEQVLSALLDELAKEEQVLFEKIQLYELEDYLWKQVEKDFGYSSEHLSIKDFSVSLFKSCYEMELNHDTAMKQTALVFMHRWKDSVRYHDSFEILSAHSAEILNIEGDLQHRTIEELLEIDLFRLIDQRLVSQLIQKVNNHTITGGNVTQIVWRRRSSHWFKAFEDLYLTVQFAAQFITCLEQNRLEINDPLSGVNQYLQNWYQLDFLYRKTLYHARQARQSTLLEGLLEQIENLYTNRFLLPVNDRWQLQLNTLDHWEVPNLRKQQNFYQEFVMGFLQQQKRLVVIISDALRYEIASELKDQIQGMKGYEANLDAMMGILPSYTQLGMAALLPHRTLEIKEDSTVLVDGLPSAGLENRARILQQASENQATAVRAEDVLSMNRDNLRDLLRDHGLLYVYHNQIDMVGDKRDSEQRVFAAVEETMQELITLIKKFANANTSYILVTTDHGFIYQDREIEDSDYASEDVSTEGVSYKNRRFVLGHQVSENSSVTKYGSDQIGLNGDLEILIPKSINRLRKQGAGSRFVHGGSSLQEILIPVLTVHKIESREIPKVNVEVIQSTTTTITSNQISVTLYQKEPVQENCVSRNLRVGFYALDGTQISNIHELIFDLKSENGTEREVKVRFLINQAAENYNNQSVVLRLEEQAADTSHFTVYKESTFRLKKSFTSDFDF